MENYCENVEENGKNDIAIMTLDRKIDLSKLQHVKPACNYKDYAWTEITVKCFYLNPHKYPEYNLFIHPSRLSKETINGKIILIVMLVAGV